MRNVSYIVVFDPKKDDIAKMQIKQDGQSKTSLHTRIYMAHYTALP